MLLAACGGEERLDSGSADTPGGSRAGESGTGQSDARDRPADGIGAELLPDGPSALDDPDDDALPAPLVDTDRILAGGPPPDGIPPIDEPSYTVVDAVDFLADVEPVLVVTVDGPDDSETRIFPVQILTWHEIVNDEIAGVPVSVSYCPLCNSAITYDRRIDPAGAAGGRPGVAVLDFGTSGSLFDSALVMYDRQTESLWSHFTGAAIAGVLTGVELDVFPTATVSWAQARTAHPDALVLDRDTGFSRDYGRNPYGGYDDVTTSPFLYDGEDDGRLPAKERVVGVEIGGDGLAVRTEALDPTAVVDADVGGVAVTVWRVAGLASALDTDAIAEGREIGATGVFERVHDGRELDFRVESTDGERVIVDDATGSTWNVLGHAIDGPLRGSRLTPVPHVDTFWFAWAAYLPDTTIVPGPDEAA